MKCLDTSVIIDLFKGNRETEKELEELGNSLAVTYPTLCELYKGVYRTSNPKKGEKKVGELLQHVETLKTSPRAARIFGKLKTSYTEKQEFDLMIASICIAEKAELITKDQDFKEIEELKKQILSKQP